MSDETVFYEVATLSNVAFNDPGFALIRVDTSMRVGAGVEGIVVSKYWTRPEAEDAATLARMPTLTPRRTET